jgi:hypothetical protein
MYDYSFQGYAVYILAGSSVSANAIIAIVRVTGRVTEAVIYVSPPTYCPLQDLQIHKSLDPFSETLTWNMTLENI